MECTGHTMKFEPTDNPETAVSTSTTSFTQNAAALVALFIPAGLSKLTGFQGSVGYISSVGLPMPSIAAALAMMVEIGAGLALIAGAKTRIAALALAGFTLVASFFFHAYWGAPTEKKMVQQLLFIKNIAVVGGLLTLAAWGCRRLEP